MPVAGARRLRPGTGELAVLAVVALVAIVVPLVGDSRAAGGGFVLGTVAGATLALHAVGVVLVHRCHRFVNVAQVQVGATAAALFAVLVQAQPMLRGIEAVCPPCIDEVGPGLRTVNYVVALVVCLALAVGVSRLVHAAVVRRFATAPRLVLMVATIFVAQVLFGVQDSVDEVFTTEEQRAQGVLRGAVTPPGDVSVRILGTTLHTGDLIRLAAAVVAVVGIALWLRRTTAGTQVRAVAADPERAGTVGIDVGRVTGRVWVVAGLLSGVAGLAAAMTGGAAGAGGGLSVSTLVRILAAATVARFASLPLAGVAAVVLGLFDQAALTAFGTSTPADGALLVIVGLLLLLQREERRRADADATGWGAARELRPIPAVLRELPAVRSAARTATGVLAVVLLGLPWVLSPSQASQTAVAMAFAIVGLSLLVLTGWAGQVSLGQFAFAAVGGYVAVVLRLPPPLALVAGAAAGAVAAVVVGLPALKLQGLNLAVTTLAFALATSAILLSPRYLGAALPEQYERPSILGFDLDDARVSYYVSLFLLVLAAVAVAGLRRSRLGRVLIAARDNQPTIEAFGVDVVRARLTAFAASGALAASAGVLFAWQQSGVQAESFSPERSVDVFVFTVIGGLGSLAGPLLGFAFYAVLAVASVSPAVVALSSGLGGLVLLAAAPGGLLQAAGAARDGLLRRIARRNNVVLVEDDRTASVDGRADILPPPPADVAGHRPRYRLEEFALRPVEAVEQ